MIKFQRTYGGKGDDHGRSVQQTFDKGYIIAGTTSSFGYGATDVYLLKTDSLGNLKWSKTFGGANVDWGYSIQQTTDSGFVITGFTNSFGNGGYDVYLIKTNSIGDTLWTKTYGGSNWDFGYSIRQSSDGCYIITGGTYSYGAGNEDVYLIKTNSSGDTLWTKTFGGSAEDEAESVWENTDGTYILAGYTESFGAGSSDCYTIKVNQNGDSLWTKTLGGTGDDRINCVKQVSDGDFIQIGYSNSFGSGNYDFYLVKINSAGDTSWTYLSGSTDDKLAYSVTQKSSDGGYFFVGSTSYLGPDVFYFRTHPGPGWMPINNGTYGDATSSPDNAYSVNETADGGNIMVGSTESFGMGLTDVYLIKTTDSGVAFNFDAIQKFSTNNIEYKIYPNPFNDYATIEISQEVLNGKNDFLFSIYDITGRRLKSYPFLFDKMKIKKEDLESGIYFFHLEKNSNVRICGKFIIQ